MFTYQKIVEKGELFRQKFSEIDFVGEIEIPQQELEALCCSIWKNLDTATLNENARALLTVVVVNLAYYTRENLDTNSFRWLVLNKLSGSNLEDTVLWQEKIGSPVLSVLNRYFQAEIINRPGKFVRPILQHAGVPYSSIPQFTDFFLQLTGRYGLPITHRDYQSFIASHQIHSTILANFLDTEAGFHYCREIGRIYSNVRTKLLTFAELEELSPRVRETIKEIWRRSNGEIDRSPVKEEFSKVPRLAIDKNQGRLMLLFSEESVGSNNIRYSIDGAGQVFQSTYYLTSEQFKEKKISGTVRHHAATEDWEVDIWQPDVNPWAVFAVASGIFVQSTGKVSAGECLLVIPSEYEPPDVIEECGYFYHPAGDYRIYHVALTEGFQIPEINFQVGSSSYSAPSLKFTDSKNAVRYSVHTFLGQAPAVCIENWNSQTSKEYLVLVKQNGKTERIPESSIRDGIINHSFEAQTQAQLKLEPKGKALRGFRESGLFLTVIPQDFKLSYDEVLYEYFDEPVFEIAPAEKISIIDGNDSIAQVGHGKYKTSPNADVIDLRLRYEEGPAFTIAAPVYRFRVTSEIIEDGILWQDKLSQKASLMFSFSPRERKQNVELGLYTSGKFVRVCDLKKIPAGLFLNLPTDQIKDAFEDCKLASGVISVKTRSGKIIRSNVTYANEKLIIEQAADPNVDLDELIELLPENFARLLKEKRLEQISGKEIAEVLPESYPDSIVEWFESPVQDFELEQSLLRDLIVACRHQQWQRASKSEIGQAPHGKLLVDMAKIYHEALEALKENNTRKYNRSLESIIHQLGKIDGSDGLTKQVAIFLRAVCYLRLKESALAAGEASSLNEAWKQVVNQLGLADLQTNNLEDESTKQLTTDDVIFHQNDLKLFEINLENTTWN